MRFDLIFRRNVFFCLESVLWLCDFTGQTCVFKQFVESCPFWNKNDGLKTLKNPRLCLFVFLFSVQTKKHPSKSHYQTTSKDNSKGRTACQTLNYIYKNHIFINCVLKSLFFFKSHVLKLLNQTDTILLAMLFTSRNYSQQKLGQDSLQFAKLEFI